jgi:hypothetical protein
MAAGDLTTLTAAKDWLSIKTDANDALLTRLVSAVSQFIQTWLDRQIAVQDYTEMRDGHGGNRLAFANYPVTAVAAVLVDGRAIPASPDFLTPGYRFTPTMLILEGYVFTRGSGNVALTYTAGYAATPLELEQACLELVAARYKERDHIGQDAQSMQGQNVTFSTRDLPADVATVLGNWKKVMPV